MFGELFQKRRVLEGMWLATPECTNGPQKNQTPGRQKDSLDVSEIRSGRRAKTTHVITLRCPWCRQRHSRRRRELVRWHRWLDSSRQVKWALERIWQRRGDGLQREQKNTLPQWRAGDNARVVWRGRHMIRQCILLKLFSYYEGTARAI